MKKSASKKDSDIKKVVYRNLEKRRCNHCKIRYKGTKFQRWCSNCRIKLSNVYYQELYE